MSIKDLFYKKTVALENKNTLTSSVESYDLIEQINLKNSDFQPDIDFSDPASFVKFGSAEEYYRSSIKRIYEQYPYDGSEAERLKFQNNSTYLDRWLYENKYPKSTGYAIFSANGWGSTTLIQNVYGQPADLEYIYSSGDIRTISIDQHTSSENIGTEAIKNNFDSANTYDHNKNKTIPFRLNMTGGTTIQFWLKKNSFDASKTKKEVILDLWNGEQSGSDDYGRLILEVCTTASSIPALRLSMASGSHSFIDQGISLNTYDATAFANSTWTHHTITLKSSNQKMLVDYYKNGLLNKSNEFDTGLTFYEIPGVINSYIGALQTSSVESTYWGGTYNQTFMKGAGKLSASMDDFRFWKKDLNAEYIYNTWFNSIGGGSNTDDSRNDLGVYYKFNEGIVGNSDFDSVVLDYSGRATNGAWTGYSSASRNTGSAFVSASVLANEPEDPIIRIDHPEVIYLLNEMQVSGSRYDQTNPSKMYDMIPAWLREEDTNNNIEFLTQIMSSYFDTLCVKIKELPRLKEKNYFSGSNPMPHSFIDRLLEDRGIIVPNSFISADVMEKFWMRDHNNTKFEQDLEITKRLIYYNIYNNLDFILKSKGTEKSFRNLLRCYGVDDELIKLNVYTDNGTHRLIDRYKNTSLKTKFLNFNNTSRFEASVINTTSSTNNVSFIPSSVFTKLSAFTIEGDFIFPKKFKPSDKNFFVTSFITSSIFGYHQAKATATDYDWHADDYGNLQVYSVRDAVNSDRVKFVLTNYAGTIYQETDFYDGVYDNQRWNFSLCVSPQGYPNYGYLNLTNSNADFDYTAKLYGVTHENENILHEFEISAKMNFELGSNALTGSKRFFIGAHKQNFFGTTIASTDLKAGSTRLWLDKLDNEVIRQHNIDPSNYGHDKIYGAVGVIAEEKQKDYLAGSDSLLFHWNFNQNSGSEANGTLIVEDFSSGSTYGSMAIVRAKKLNRGYGFGFENSGTDIAKNEFIFARKKELPEISFTDDNVIIMNKDKNFLIEDEDTTDNVFSLEKSMYQSVSEEMLNTVATMKEYANLFAKPVDYYRQEHKRMRVARQLFFNRVTNNLDFEKYTEYFKWIDSSLSFFIEQIKPINATFTDGVANVVESHIFERPKNPRKFPTVKTLSSTEGSMRGISELSYNWKFGHSPEYKGSTENIHCEWTRTREERTDIADREVLRKIINSETISFVKRLGTSARTPYIAEGYAEATRRFSRPYKLSVEASNTIHGGTNYNQNKNRDFIYDSVKPHGSKTNLGIPVNVVVVGVGAGQGLINNVVCDDEEKPNEKEKFDFRMTVGKDSSEDGSQPSTASLDLVYEVKSAFGSPFNIFSGSIPNGANRKVNTNYKSDVYITNLHSDTTYMANDVPMQGPFTETWIGGRQNRHVRINRFNEDLITEGGGAPTNNLDDQYTRPESFRLLFGEHPDEAVQDGALGFVGPDYGGPYPDTSRKWAIYYRGFRAKRPYNVQNIQGDQYRQGNYTRKYEYFSSVGRFENNSRFKKARSATDYELSGTFLPAQIKTALPETTNPMTLVGQEPFTRGNVFGTHLNNRQPDSQVTEPASTSSVSFIVNDRNSIDDGILLQITGASVDVLVETVASSIAKNNPDIEITTGPRGLALMADTTTTAIAQDTTYSGIGTDDFSYSFWHNDVSGSVAGANTRIGFAKSSISDAHHVRFSSTSEIKVVLEDNSNNTDTETFSTTVEANVWNHYVVSIPNSDLASGVPKLWKNGVELSGDGGYTGLAGGTPDIADAYIYLDEHAAIQDLIVWDKLLTNEDVSVIYNKGKIFDPQNHNSSSNVIDWFKFGNEPYWASLGYTSGSQLDDIGGSITRFISSSFGTGNNSLSISNSTDHEWQFIQGLISGSFSYGQHWNTLSSSLSSSFPLWKVSYNTINAGTQALFELQKYSAGSNTVGLTKSGHGTTGISGLVVNSGTDDKLAKDIIIQRESDFLTGSTRNKTVITSRFSAPGGIEVQTYAYLDAYSREYSVHNNLNYKNLSVRGSGSGENGTIRVNSHANTRDGLRTLYQRPMGLAGTDSVYGAPDSSNYEYTASFHKIPRNTLVTPRSGSSAVEIVERSNNYNYQSVIPSSDYNYSWVTSSLGNNYSVRSGTQKVFGYWPKDGINKVNGVFDSAITFPTASDIVGV